MRPCFVLALFFLAWPFHAGFAETRVRIVETDPPGENVRLARDEALYVRMAFSADEPVSIWARPFFQGKEVPMKSNASISHSGSGYALGWFAGDKPYRVDEIRIRLGGGKPYRQWEAGRYRIDVQGTLAAPAARTRAAWVHELRAQEEAVRRAEYEKRAHEPVGAGAWLFFAGFMLAVLALLVAGLAWPVWGMWKWRGGWRMAATVPAVLMGFVVLRIAFDTARDPTSHNLWPFEVLQFGVVSVLIMAGLKIARRFARPAS